MSTQLATSERRAISLFRRDIVTRALLDSFTKLDPRVQIRNPVMFVVEIGAVITTITWFIQLGGGKALGGYDPAWFTFTISVWLWLTVVFANMAEAFAEGRGRAQADTLRAMRKETMATMQDGRAIRRPPSSSARRHRRRRRRRGDPRRRHGDRGHRDRRRVGDHRRVRAGDPRVRRRSQRRHRRHARDLRPDRRRDHPGARQVVPRPHDRARRGRRAAQDARTRSRSTSCSPA